jgi:hypothetical protein
MTRKTFGWLAQAGITVVQFLATKTAFAQNIQLPNPLASGGGCNDLGCVTTKIISIIFTISIPVCAIMVLWGGFIMLTSAGNPEKVSTGRKTILYAAIGFVIVLFANSVPAFIQAFFQ